MSDLSCVKPCSERERVNAAFASWKRSPNEPHTIRALEAAMWDFRWAHTGEPLSDPNWRPEQHFKSCEGVMHVLRDGKLEPA